MGPERKTLLKFLILVVRAYQQSMISRTAHVPEIGKVGISSQDPGWVRSFFSTQHTYKWHLKKFNLGLENVNFQPMVAYFPPETKKSSKKCVLIGKYTQSSLENLTFYNPRLNFFKCLLYACNVYGLLIWNFQAGRHYRVDVIRLEYHEWKFGKMALLIFERLFLRS